MKIDEIKDMWEEDTIIDETRLAKESLKSPQLHSKYLNLLIDSKIRVAAYKHDLARKQLLKARYWRGELTKAELEENNWPQWQYNKPLKSELENMLDADDDCIKIKNKIEYFEIMIQQLDSIMGSIKSRSFDIKNAIDFVKFQAGA